MRFSKIFGIGLPRTGTTSLNIALNQLGLASKHFPFELYSQQDHASLKQYIGQYTGLLDAPIPYMYKELDSLYPGSGFILTTRPVEDWLRSMAWLLDEGRCIWEWSQEYDSYNEVFFGSSTFKRELFENHYYSFHKEVSDYFQNRNDFLILDLKKGYGYKELCDFLEVPILNSEYPKGNEARKARHLQRLAYLTGQDGKSLGKLLRRLDHYLIRCEQEISKIF